MGAGRGVGEARVQQERRLAHERVLGNAAFVVCAVRILDEMTEQLELSDQRLSREVRRPRSRRAARTRRRCCGRPPSSRGGRRAAAVRAEQRRLDRVVQLLVEHARREHLADPGKSPRRAVVVLDPRAPGAGCRCGCDRRRSPAPAAWTGRQVGAIERAARRRARVQVLRGQPRQVAARQPVRGPERALGRHVAGLNRSWLATCWSPCSRRRPMLPRSACPAASVVRKYDSTSCDAS